MNEQMLNKDLQDYPGLVYTHNPTKAVRDKELYELHEAEAIFTRDKRVFVKGAIMKNDDFKQLLEAENGILERITSMFFADRYKRDFSSSLISKVISMMQNGKKQETQPSP